jgi:hypothetical protein
MMEEAISTKLLATTALTALVGTRIHWGQRPQAGALPAVTMFVVDSIPVYADDGDHGMTSARVQIDCWASDADGVNGQSKAIQVARQVRAALESVSMTVGGVTFVGVFPNFDAQDYTPEQGQGGVVIYRRSLEFQLMHLT